MRSIKKRKVPNDWGCYCTHIRFKAHGCAVAADVARPEAATDQFAIRSGRYGRNDDTAVASPSLRATFYVTPCFQVRDLSIETSPDRLLLTLESATVDARIDIIIDSTSIQLGSSRITQLGR